MNDDHIDPDTVKTIEVWPLAADLKRLRVAEADIDPFHRIVFQPGPGFRTTSRLDILLDHIVDRQRSVRIALIRTARSHQVVLEGQEIFDDRDCYKLKVTLADSTVEFWYIDAETFLEVGMSGDTYDFGIKNSLETFFSDYQEVDGVIFPFLIESEYGQRYRSMEIETIKVNTEIDSSVFALPEATEKE